MHFDEKLSELEQEYVQTVKSLNSIEGGSHTLKTFLHDTENSMIYFF